LNDFCVAQKIHYVYGGATAFSGAALEVRPGKACLRCVFGDFSEEELLDLEGGCRAQGIVGVVAGIVGLEQAEFALRSFLLEASPAKSSELFRFALEGSRRTFSAVLPSADCPNHCLSIYLDLLQLSCPETFLYTKLALEELPHGVRLEILFGNEISARNVSRSCQEEGYRVLIESEPLTKGRYKTVILKESRAK